jgi:hypothetical protein
VTGLSLGYVRGLLELVRGRDQDALAAFRHAERLARTAAPTPSSEPALWVCWPLVSQAMNHAN